MKIADLMLCAKPLIFENQDEEFRYSIQGTCAAVSYRGGFYALTAKHCFNDRDLASARIHMIAGDLTWAPIREIYTWDGDMDFYDLAVIEFDIGTRPPDSFKSPHCLRLNAWMIASGAPPRGALLALVGYPASDNSINYESLEVCTKPFLVDGSCLGSTEQIHCSIMRFNNVEPIEHLNGMSGSPVLRFDEISDGDYRAFFAGMLIQGTKQSKIGRFINSEVIFHALNEVIRRR